MIAFSMNATPGEDADTVDTNMEIFVVDAELEEGHRARGIASRPRLVSRRFGTRAHNERAGYGFPRWTLKDTSLSCVSSRARCVAWARRTKGSPADW